ncbi:MAG: CorA family divalent cation transporter [Lachnospiraceae bacterium]|nr:CorA family divalent cation transporter [Lachnospiraceae bacterium]
MTVFALGSMLEEVEESQLEEEARSLVFLTDVAHARDAMRAAGMVYDGEISLSDVVFSKIETQQECLAGSLSIPRLLDVLGSRNRILIFINRRNIVILDDSSFSRRLIVRIQRSKLKQGVTKERFLYNFITQFMSRDLEMLARYERRIMELEERVMNGKTEGFQSEITPIRKELLTLRGYYDEVMDMGKELEENENGFFSKKQIKYFGTIADRADRLMGRTAHLLEYAQQVREAYQTQVDAEQNKNMQFLTVISTIFFPLTLITGWYGMNFNNMPELQRGYPGVIMLSLVVVVVCVMWFKKKKML